jgi:aminopeptidase N
LSHCTKDKFELLDSSLHDTNFHPIIIKYMYLFIEPNYESHSISCIQELKLQCQKDFNDTKEAKLELDSVKINVKKITYIEDENSEPKDELGFIAYDEKCIIKLPRLLKEKDNFKLKIEYSAQPKRGFRFISPESNYPNKRKQTWTQGQMMESRFWFPCIDEPQMKFPWEISIIVPEGFTAISNGIPCEVLNRNDGTILYKWKEDNPNSPYLVSIVTGKFHKADGIYRRESLSHENESEVELLYYVPEDKKDRVERSFHWTPHMMKFFEEYFGVPYPYFKYVQTTVQDFEYLGMENVSCTTLQDEFLLDTKASIDDSSTRRVIAHELAHQWFGDLVTCKDWAHIWLNEGMATYCEALYIEKEDKKDEFQYYMQAIGEIYIRKSCNEYQRPLVTNVYKYPDELLDAHSYQKGAWIFHMLRNIVGESKFKEALNKCLIDYKGKNIDTYDFRLILEQTSGQNLAAFFKQWVFNAGHPELEIHYDKQGNQLKIIQKQDILLDFGIELKLYLLHNNIPKTYLLRIRDMENNFILSEIDKIAKAENIELISIDPELKVLKNIRKYRVPTRMILSQIRKGETIIERIQAIRALNFGEITHEELDEVIALLEDKISNDSSFRISSLAAAKLGLLGNDAAYESLVRSLDSSENDINPKRRAIIRTSIVSAISSYIPAKAELRDKLVKIIEKDDDNESYNVQGKALIAISKYKDKQAFEKLKTYVEKENTFNDIIPAYAIQGLPQFNNLAGLEDDAINLILRKTSEGNPNNIRSEAVANLTDFLINGNNEIQETIFNCLIDSLDDKWPDTRKASLTILQNTFSPDDTRFDQSKIDEILKKLDKMINEDISYEVRRCAEIALIKIREKEAKKVQDSMITKDNISNYILTMVRNNTQRSLVPEYNILSSLVTLNDHIP